MYYPGKIHNVLKEMKKLQISILGISEMRWPNSGKVVIDDHTVVYAGEGSPQHRNGVAIIMLQEIIKAVQNVVYFSDRIILIQLQTTTTNFNVLQVYASTSEYDDEQVESFYNDLEQVLALTKSHKMTIVMGDFNVKIGEEKQENIIGDHGLGDYCIAG